MRSRFTTYPVLLSIALGAFTGCSRSPAYVGSTDVELDPSIAVSVAPIERLDDSQLKHLIKASENWQESRGPMRAVVDQIVLVDDEPSFFAALATWNAKFYFPILIDDPHWTPAFVRAFRPARIVRSRAPAQPSRGGPLAEWRTAEGSVGRSWMRGEEDAIEPPPVGSPPHDLGPTPPGVVLSHPGSPSLAGAAALAAGRFQPLLRLEPLAVETAQGKPPRLLGFDDLPTLGQALDFARHVESRVASIAPEYGRLGDQVDFLTLAGDWPYRYRAAGGLGVATDDRALDDLLGRNLPSGSVDVDSLRLRWAFAGRLLGNASASVSRAMASLFLQPRSALFWNTYSGGPPWSEYDVTGATSIMRLIRAAPDAVVARSGAAADLISWHEATAAPNARDLVVLNTSGAPGEFSIPRGPGISADVPFGPPAVVSMIHSFSAASPTDPATIAGRYLERGAYVYYGSMNEPYLTAFRSPYLVAQLMSVETPLAAALRQGPYEAFGQPWRLVYLGDPLYRLKPLSDHEPAPRIAAVELSVDVSPLTAGDRPNPLDQERTLDWCYDIALLALTRPDGEVQAPAKRAREVLDVLSILDPERLSTDRRAKFDALLIDQSAALGDFEGLLRSLLQSSARTRSPFVWRAIETAALNQLADCVRRGDFARALDLWYPIAVGPWPADSDFPARLTRRLALAAESEGPVHLEPFRRRLTNARDQLEGSKILPERRSMLAEELKRIGNSSPGG